MTTVRVICGPVRQECHLGIPQKCGISGPIPDLLQQNPYVGTQLRLIPMLYLKD